MRELRKDAVFIDSLREKARETLFALPQFVSLWVDILTGLPCSCRVPSFHGCNIDTLQQLENQS